MPKASLNADYVRTEISRWQARSMAMSTRSIVAAENPLAAQAGAVVLGVGGHMVDAAIAANAVICRQEYKVFGRRTPQADGPRRCPQPNNGWNIRRERHSMER